MVRHLVSGFGIASFVALAGAGCAVRDDDGSVADDAAAIEVNVCKRGNEVPPSETEWALHTNYATYNATHGVRIRVGGPHFAIPFNPIEFGLQVQLPFESHQDALTLDPVHVEACLGTLRVLPGAKVQLPTTDAATVAWFCAPDTLDGTKCDLKDGAELLVSVHALLQQHGFVSTTDFLNLRASATTRTPSSRSSRRTPGADRGVPKRFTPWCTGTSGAGSRAITSARWSAPP